MARQLISYCGIDCARCPNYAYRRPGVAEWLRRFFGRQPKAAAGAVCEGCTTIDARCVQHCLTCPARCCAMETGVPNCAHCPKFPCERLDGIWKVIAFKDAEPRLRDLHGRLAGEKAVAK